MKYNFRNLKDERGNNVGHEKTANGCDVIGTEEGRALVLADLERLQQPADAGTVEGWLAELSVIVAKRPDDEFSETLRLQAYASRLREYPADVARAALLGKSWKFWPAWAELKTECDRLSGPRRAMIFALSAHNRQQTEQQRERVSAEAAARIMQEIWGDK